jgi:hypothetical protein
VCKWADKREVNPIRPRAGVIGGVYAVDNIIKFGHFWGKMLWDRNRKILNIFVDQISTRGIPPNLSLFLPKITQKISYAGGVRGGGGN